MVLNITWKDRQYPLICLCPIVRYSSSANGHQLKYLQALLSPSIYNASLKSVSIYYLQHFLLYTTKLLNCSSFILSTCPNTVIRTYIPGLPVFTQFLHMYSSHSKCYLIASTTPFLSYTSFQAYSTYIFLLSSIPNLYLILICRYNFLIVNFFFLPRLFFLPLNTLFTVYNTLLHSRTIIATFFSLIFQFCCDMQTKIFK